MVTLFNLWQISNWKVLLQLERLWNGQFQSTQIIQVTQRWFASLLFQHVIRQDFAVPTNCGLPLGIDSSGKKNLWGLVELKTQLRMRYLPLLIFLSCGTLSCPRAKTVVLLNVTVNQLSLLCFCRKFKAWTWYTGVQNVRLQYDVTLTFTLL